jgi:YD repeat-containing protein
VVVANRSGYTWQYGYDAQGRTNTVIDPNGLATYTYYDSLGRTIQKQEPANTGTSSPTITGFGWTQGDALASVTDPRSLVTTYTPDGLGNVKGEVSPDRGTLAYTYDANGNVKTMTDARGKVTTYTYDAINRVKTISYPTGTGTIFEYDGGANPTANEAGELTKVTDESGSTTYVHDAMGRLITKTVIIQGKTFTVRYTWGDSGTALDKLTNITYPSGAVVNYTYDAYGSVSGMTVTPAGAKRRRSRAAQLVGPLTAARFMVATSSAPRSPPPSRTPRHLGAPGKPH